MSYLGEMFAGLAELTPMTVSILAAIFVLAIVLAVLGKKTNYNTKVIVYGGLCVAISFVLSYIRLYRWPQGGSITLASMLPMFVFSYIFGPAAGISAGAVYGLLQLIQDPYILHPVQVLLDYIIAFAAMGLSGFARENVSLGVLLGGFGRFFSSFLSGVIFFGSYAPDGMSPILYSISVNATIIGTDALICFVISLMPQVKEMIEQLKHEICRGDNAVNA